MQCFYFWEECAFSKGHCLWHMASIKHWSQLSLFLGCYVSSIICLMNKAVGEISFHLKSFIVWMTVTFNKTNYHFFYLCYLLAFSWSEVCSCRVVVQTRLLICGSLLQPVMSWHLEGHFLICLPDVLVDFFTLLGPDNLIMWLYLAVWLRHQLRNLIRCCSHSMTMKTVSMVTSEAICYL